MAYIDKDKAVDAIAMYIFINDAIKSGKPIRVTEYKTFANGILKDVPETDIVRCGECKYYYDGHWCSEWEYTKKKPDDFCSYGERREP